MSAPSHSVGALKVCAQILEYEALTWGRSSLTWIAEDIFASRFHTLMDLGQKCESICPQIPRETGLRKDI